MSKWSVVFLVLAIVAGVLGFIVLKDDAAITARGSLIILGVLFLVSIVLNKV